MKRALILKFVLGSQNVRGRPKGTLLFPPLFTIDLACPFWPSVNVQIGKMLFHSKLYFCFFTLYPSLNHPNWISYEGDMVKNTYKRRTELTPNSWLKYWSLVFSSRIGMINYDFLEMFWLMGSIQSSPVNSFHVQVKTWITQKHAYSTKQQDKWAG